MNNQVDLPEEMPHIKYKNKNLNTPEKVKVWAKLGSTIPRKEGAQL